MEFLNSLDPRGPMAKSDQKPTFILPLHYRQGMELYLIDCVHLLFHEQLFSSMVKHTNNISDGSAKVTAVEMRRFIGIRFAMTLSTVNPIEDDWKTDDDGLMPASQSRRNLSIREKSRQHRVFYA